MKTIQWSKNISVNNNEIDNQHKRLFKLTNKLILHSNAKADSKIINEALYGLLEYTKYHFYAEEEFLEKHKYPKINEHKKEHKKFVYQVALFCENVIDRKSTVTSEMISFLVDWLLQHTSIDDQDYKNYLST